jgi:transposase
MIGAPGADGSTALMVIEGATDAAVVRAYVPHVLVPTLRPGEIVVMDNLSSHKGPAIREMIEAVGAELWFLPPYSPDLNPIEKMWSKVKAILRRLKPRTTDKRVSPQIRETVSRNTRNSDLAVFQFTLNQDTQQATHCYRVPGGAVCPSFDCSIRTSSRFSVFSLPK